MSGHLDLFALLRGELSNAEVVAAGDHLAECTTCQEELADSVIGHALLTRAGRTLGPAVGGPAEPVRLPALPGARGGRRWLPTVAAAAAVVLAVGTAGALLWERQRGPTSPVAGNRVEAPLAPVSGDTGGGRVEMVEHDGRTQMTLAVTDLPRTDRTDYYYAWLLDPSTNKMLALGLVDADGRVSFDLDDALVASYSVVDVSLESDDGDPAHSATSVLRGSYEPSEITTAEGKPR